MSEALANIEELPQESNQNVLSEMSKFYQIKFRQKGHIYSASSKIQNLANKELVMLQTDHGQEPAEICGQGVVLPLNVDKPPALYTIARRASRDEIAKFDNLVQREHDALEFCTKSIKTLGLSMKLIRVERYFNGSKIIFYFTAESRVDFRALVKDLVQEFRTRVEMRQIGVRHETQMLGGLGCCGRELCCASFMTKFVPVSIKMAKEQNLPLNPSKISGACNRLLCCLTHEFETYKSLKKEMPKPGKNLEIDGQSYKVKQINILKGTVEVTSVEQPEVNKVLTRDEWETDIVVSEHRKQKEPAPAKEPLPQKKARKRRHPKKGKK